MDLDCEGFIKSRRIPESAGDVDSLDARVEENDVLLDKVGDEVSTCKHVMRESLANKSGTRPAEDNWFLLECDMMCCRQEYFSLLRGVIETTSTC